MHAMFMEGSVGARGMELQKAVRTRRSVRAYRPDPVPEATVEALVELANAAPSAGNLQAREFVVVRDAGMRAALAEVALKQEFVAQAPVVVVVCADPERSAEKYGSRGKDLFCIQDAAAATENLLLAAHDAGLGAIWVGAFEEAAVARLLDLPREVRPVSLVPLGWPGEDPPASERRPLGEILHHDRW